MKKVIIILLVLAVSLTGLFAATIQVGPSARFNGDISNVETISLFQIMSLEQKQE